MQKDTALKYSVSTPFFPEEKKIKLSLPQYSNYGGDDYGADDETDSDLTEEGFVRNKVIVNDTTGEKIYIIFSRASKYFYSKDSSAIFSEKNVSYMGDTTWIVRFKKKTFLPGNWRVVETAVSYTHLW